MWNGWHPAIEFGMYAENFRAAARYLVKELSEDELFTHSASTTQSFRAYPAFYLYRHAFELALKGIIVAGADLVAHLGGGMNEALYTNHGFKVLQLDLERVFEAIGWDWDLGIPGFKTVQDFRRVLAEFDEFDRSSAVCRYPVTAAGKASMEKQQCVNLFEFAETMEALLEVVNELPSTVTLEVDRYFSALSDSVE
jgi:hypothetical protein